MLNWNCISLEGATYACRRGSHCGDIEDQGGAGTFGVVNKQNWILCLLNQTKDGYCACFRDGNERLEDFQASVDPKVGATRSCAEMGIPCLFCDFFFKHVF